MTTNVFQKFSIKEHQKLGKKVLMENYLKNFWRPSKELTAIKFIHHVELEEDL